jgi:hypothetical protein
MGSAKKGGAKVYDFLMSVDYALCHGPIDHFNQVSFRKKAGWVGPAFVDGATYIDKADLFGGDDGGEGGVAGTLEFYKGRWNQKMSSALARRFGLTPDTAPGYRGLAHVFFHGSRPPGEQRIISIRDNTVVRPNYSGSLDGTPGVDFTQFLFADVDPLGESWIPSVDSGRCTFFMDWLYYREDTGSGSRVWDGGANVQFYDASDNNIGSAYYNAYGDGYARYPGGLTPGRILAVIPPLTRKIRYIAGVTMGGGGVVRDLVQIEADAGPLVNHFGDNFEYSDIDPGGRKGFKWSTNNPYFQGPEFSVTCAPRGLEEYPEVEPLIWPIVGVNENGAYLKGSMESAFEREDVMADDRFWDRVGERVRNLVLGPSHRRSERFRNEKCNLSHLPDANPAAMIFECMTNPDWGKGDPLEAFDVQSYVDSAVTLQNENFGLTMYWAGQDTIETFVAEVLDHVKGMQFQHPRTGLWTLKLLRDDYDPGACRQFDPSNCLVRNVRTRLWGETINEIVVSYTNPENEEEETVSAQNLSNIAIQGGVLSDGRDYHGIRNPWLAKIVAERDVNEASAILTSCDIILPRSDDDILPGEVISLEWPRQGVSGYFRVNSVKPGSSRDKKVTLQVTQDVFSVTSYDRSVSAMPVPINRDSVLPEDVDQRIVLSAPYVALQNGADTDIEYPFNRLAISASDSERDYSRIEVLGETLRANGSEGFGMIRSIVPPTPAQLGVEMAREALSLLPATVVENASGLNVEAGALFVIGESDLRNEIVMLDTYEPATDSWQIIRGVYDTVPQVWLPSDMIWDGAFLSEPLASGTYVEHEEVDLYFLSHTLSRSQDILDVSPDTHVVVERANAPLRPANLSVGGAGFAGAYYIESDLPVEIPLSWANRNRTSEDTVVPRWDDGNVTPETGQTTTIRFWGGENFDVLEHELSEVGGTTASVDPNQLVTFKFYEVEFVAVRNGIESYQGARLPLEIERLGYGNNYDFDYGENDGGM